MLLETLSYISRENLLKLLAVFKLVIKHQRKIIKLKRTIFETLVLERSGFNWRRRRMWVEYAVGLLKGTPGHTQGLSGAWSWLVIVSNFTSQFETPLHSLLQVSLECLCTVIEGIVSLCVLEREQSLRGKGLSWENHAGDRKRKPISTATNSPTTGFPRGKKRVTDAACLKNGCRAVCLSRHIFTAQDYLSPKS